MAVWDKRILWGFTLLLAGAVGRNIVNYPRPVCAMKGSTVTLPCTFETPEYVNENGKKVLIEIRRVVWCPNHLICQRSTPSVYDSESNNNDPRYRYLGDKKGNCTLQISNLQKEDNATFRFRVGANHRDASFAGQPGVNVTVSGKNSPMKIKSSSTDTEMREGESVTLQCTAVCTFHQLEVTWFRDGSTLSETGPALKLDPLTAEDSGNYTCGLKNNSPLSQPYSLHVAAEEEGTTSAAVDTMMAIRLVLFTLHTVLIIVVACIIIKRTCACKKAAA